MGCSACGGGAGGGNMVQMPHPSISETIHEPCDYTIDQLKIWKTYLLCFKDNEYYNLYRIPPSELNKHLGYVISAINYESNLCFFKKELDSAADFVSYIISTNRC